MDPKACVQRWLDAMDDDDWEEFEAAAEDYNDWVGRGGFPVKGTLDSGLVYTIWGLSGDNHDGVAMSPVQVGDAEENTFVTPHVIGEILAAA